jgi:hypothetical protein
MEKKFTHFHRLNLLSDVTSMSVTSQTDAPGVEWFYIESQLSVRIIFVKEIHRVKKYCISGSIRPFHVNIFPRLVSTSFSIEDVISVTKKI